jgi:hypothetical protein
MGQVAKTRLLAVAVTTLVFIAVVSSAYSQTGSLRPGISDNREVVIAGDYYPAWMGHPDQLIYLDQPGWNPIPVTPRAGPPKVEDDAASDENTSGG